MTVKFCPYSFLRTLKLSSYGILLFSLVCLAMSCLPVRSPSDVEQSYTNAIVACAAWAGYPGAYDPVADAKCRAEVDCQYAVGPCAEGARSAR